MKIKTGSAGRILTVLSIQGPWIKLAQARVGEKGSMSLLRLKAHKVEERTEEAFAQALGTLIHTLPVAPKEVIGLLSKGEILTRYLTLPSNNPEELKTMALYQLEGALPLPVRECVISVKVLGSVGEATRVLVAAVLRPSVEQMIRICQKGGMTLTAISVSSEAIGSWHRACWPKGEEVPSVWLAADVTGEGLDLTILMDGSPVYMRQVLHLAGGADEFVTQLRETIHAYVKERIGPAVQHITISGWLAMLGEDPFEKIESALGIPVRRMDPLENSPFQESLSVTAAEFSSEVSFSELLGTVCAPQLLTLDLLPLETRVKQARHGLFLEIRKTILLAAVGAVLVVGWMAAKIGETWWAAERNEEQMTIMQPQVDRVRNMASVIETVTRARHSYANRLRRLQSAVSCLLPDMNLQFLVSDKDQVVTLRGVAPNLMTVTNYASALEAQKIWKSVVLHSVKTQGTDLSSVEFEMVLQ